SPLGLPDTLTRSPLRRLAPFAWLARCARSRRPLSEFSSPGEFRLPGWGVDVGQQRLALAEERPAGRVVGGGQAAVRRREVGAVEHVEQLRDELDLVRPADREELREAK